MDPDCRRTVGSTRGIMYRSLARKDSRIWPRGLRYCEKRYPDSWRIVWAITESVSGVQVAQSHTDLSARSPEVLALGFTSHEVPRVGGSRGHMEENKVGPAWSTGGHVLPGDRSQHSVEFSHLGDSRNRRVKNRRFNRRGCKVTRFQGRER